MKFAIFFAEVTNSRSMDFGTNRKTAYPFLLVKSTNYNLPHTVSKLLPTIVKIIAIDRSPLFNAFVRGGCLKIEDHEIWPQQARNIALSYGANTEILLRISYTV